MCRTAGATQVKWNRRQPHLIASAHDNRVLIWDERVRLLRDRRGGELTFGIGRWEQLQ